MRVKTRVKAGALSTNHNQTRGRGRAQVVAGTHLRAQRRPLKVETQTRRAASISGHALPPRLTTGDTMEIVRTLSRSPLWLCLVALLFASVGAHAVPPTSLGVVA